MFSLDSKLYRGCRIIYKLLCVNILFIVFSLPLVTFGASFSAMIQTLKLDNEKIAQTFFQIVKQSILNTLFPMLFNIFSLLFVFSLKNINIQQSNLIHFIMLLFISFLLCYNINIYIVQSFCKTKNVYYFFRSAFYLTIGTYIKTCLFPLGIIIMLYFSLQFMGMYALFFIFSFPIWIYLKILDERIIYIENTEVEKLQSILK